MARQTTDEPVSSTPMTDLLREMIAKKFAPDRIVANVARLERIQALLREATEPPAPSTATCGNAGCRCVDTRPEENQA